MVKSSCLHHSSKKLISSAMSSHTNIIHPVACFELQTSSEFASRSMDVFGSLNTLENKHQSWMSHNETHDTFDDNSNTIEPVQDSLNVFKKPFAPLPIKRKATSTSRGRRSMKKWIKYSLADIPLSSDATNSAVAFQFLSELQKKKEQEETVAVSSSDDKLVFCKPKKANKQSKPRKINVASSSITENEDFASDVNSGQNTKDETSIKLLHLIDDGDNV